MAEPKKGKKHHRVVTSYQDNWVSHEKGAVVLIDLDKITPGENLRLMTDAEVKAWQRKNEIAQAEEESGIPADEQAAA